MTLEIAIISDIHFGPDRGTKCGSKAREYFGRFCKWLDTTKAELVVDLGDRITDVDLETDLKSAGEVGAWFQDIKIPRVHLVGNHDVALLTIAQNEAALGCPLSSTVKEIGGFCLVFWNARAKLDRQHGFSLLESDLDWLAKMLDAASAPVVLFSHVPLDNGSFRGNFYFERSYPHHACYPEAQGERVREILERSKKVVLSINGHAHWNTYHCIDGIHYVTLPSLTEMFPTYPEVCESWTLLRLGEEIELQVFGNLPITYKLTPRRADSEHWLNVHKAYAPQVAKPR